MSKNAFAIVHFGSNPVYLELELYFFIMLRKYTKNDILYLYSVNDTPSYFVDAVRPLVDEVIPYALASKPTPIKNWVEPGIDNIPKPKKSKPKTQ